MTDFGVALIGVGVALAGAWPVDWFYRYLHWIQRLDRRPTRERMDAVFVGLFERLFAFLLVGFQVPDAATLLAAWLGVKLASNWHRGPETHAPETEKREWRTRTFIAIMTGIVSLGFGILGGLIARRDIPIGL